MILRKSDQEYAPLLQVSELHENNPELYKCVSEKYEKGFVTFWIAYIVEDMMSSDFLTVMNVHSHYRYIRIAKMMIKHNDILVLVESLDGANTRSKSLENFHLHNGGCTQQPQKSYRFSSERLAAS